MLVEWLILAIWALSYQSYSELTHVFPLGALEGRTGVDSLVQISGEKMPDLPSLDDVPWHQQRKLNP